MQSPLKRSDIQPKIKGKLVLFLETRYTKAIHLRKVSPYIMFSSSYYINNQSITTTSNEKNPQELTCNSRSLLMTYSVLGPYNLTVISTTFPYSSLTNTFNTARMNYYFFPQSILEKDNLVKNSTKAATPTGYSLSILQISVLENLDIYFI